MWLKIRSAWTRLAVKPASADGIPGWFFEADERIFRWLLAEQVRTGVAGDLAEIGPFMGRSAVVVGDYVQPGETFTVVDLFEDAAADDENARENRRSYEGLTQAVFEANYRKKHADLPTIVRGLSTTIRDHASVGTHRFVHVDASHLYEHVKADIETAQMMLRPDGLVAFDDILTWHAPGVWAAVWEAVAVTGLVPIVVTPNKMYGTWGNRADAWQAELQRADLGLQFRSDTVHGRLLLQAWLAGGPWTLRRRVKVRLSSLRRTG